MPNTGGFSNRFAACSSECWRKNALNSDALISDALISGALNSDTLHSHALIIGLARPAFCGGNLPFFLPL